MTYFYQHFASWAIRIIQKYGPDAVEVLGRTYIVTPDVFNPKFYLTSEFVARNGLADRISVLQGDLFSTLPSGAQFDVILFSPPYLEGKAKERLGQALYDPSKELARRFLKEAGNYLKPNGYIQMAYSSIAEPERVLKMARESGWSCCVVAERKGLVETIYVWKLTREK